MTGRPLTTSFAHKCFESKPDPPTGSFGFAGRDTKRHGILPQESIVRESTQCAGTLATHLTRSTKTTRKNTMMWQTAVKQCLFILLALGLAACKKYDIIDPAADTLFTAPPPQYTVGYSAKPTKAPKMTLNGFEVQSLFALGDKQAVANGADLATFLKEGINIFQVDPPLGPQRKFVYDTKGPDIVVLGATLDGNNININGIAVDEKGVVSGSVNNQAISFANDGSFSITIPKADTYTYNTEDTIGHTNTVYYADLNQQYDPALTVQISQEGLNAATKLIVNVLNETDLNSAVAGTELYNGTSKGLFGETYGPDGYIKSIELSAESVGLALQNGSSAHFSAHLSRIRLELTLRSHNGLLPPVIIPLGATVGPVDISGDVILGVENEAPVIKLQNLNYNMGAIVLDGTDVPVIREISSGIISGIANALEGVITGALEKTISDSLGKMLGDMLLDGYLVRIQDHAGRNFDISASMKFKQLSTTTNELTASLAGSVLPASPDLVNIPQPYAGTLFTFDPLPQAVRNSEQLAISINSNMINQVLASAHSVGLTQMNIVGDSLQLGLPRDESFNPENVKSRILINMASPARVRVTETDGKAAPSISVYGLEIWGQSIKKGSTAFTTDVAVRVNADAGIRLGVGTADSLGVSLRDIPQFKITGIKLGSSDWSGPVANATVNALINTNIGAVMEQLAKPIEKIKLPSFACMQVDSLNITAVGNEKDHLNLAISLKQISDDCADLIKRPPEVAYGRGAGIGMSCDSSQDYDAGLCYQKCPAGYNGVGPVCWKVDASYERGVGTVPTLCAAGQEMDAGLCYPKCSAGYHGVGPVCWSDLPESYGRGVGVIPNVFTGACPAGKGDKQAGLCYTPCNAGYHGVSPVCWLDNASYGRGVGVSPNACDAGQELDAGLCYTTCNAGYHGVGPVCWTNSSISQTRGVGTVPANCPSGWDKDGALCYPGCDAGFTGVGPVCWPEGQEPQAGAGQ
ncbi:hypothetical protein HDN1F_13140 [gamma proteobacterium HdN1]|nr:hypothetical protein HDN1F_13140 [gamma proteobacterium HdN1]